MNGVPVPIQMELDSKGVGHFINLTNTENSDDESDFHIEKNVVKDNEDIDASDVRSDKNDVKDDNNVDNRNDSFEEDGIKVNEHTSTGNDVKDENTDVSPESKDVQSDVVDSSPKTFAQKLLTMTEVVIEIEESLSNDVQSSNHSSRNQDIVIATISPDADEIVDENKLNEESTNVEHNNIVDEKEIVDPKNFEPITALSTTALVSTGYPLHWRSEPYTRY